MIVEERSSVAYMKGGDDRFVGAKGRSGGSDTVYGGPGNDTLTSFTRVDMLHGGNGNDRIDGGAHKNGLYGGTGNDTLRGGANVDHFRPGRGTDICFGQLKDVNFPSGCEIARIVRR